MDDEQCESTMNSILTSSATVGDKLNDLSDGDNNVAIDILIDKENNVNITNVTINEEVEVNDSLCQPLLDLNNVPNKDSIVNKNIQNKNDIEVDQGLKSKKVKVVKKRKMKRIAILDSDSENELLTCDTKIHEAFNEKDSQVMTDEDSVFDINRTKNTKKAVIYDSDSDKSENGVASENLEHELTSKSIYGSNDGSSSILKKNKFAIADSDSEEESSVALDVQKSQNETSTTTEFNPFQASYLSALCDSESSGDEQNNEVIHLRKLENSSPITKPRKNKKSDSSVKEKPPKKMTARDAIKQRQEITSESQRMLRETPCVLPYHKPKERTIKEFLQNRPRLSLLKNERNLPASIAIKMTTEELKVVTKKMEDREKEVQIFYKSESEDEDSRDGGVTPPLEENVDDLNAPESDTHSDIINVRGEEREENTAQSTNVEEESLNLLDKDLRGEEHAEITEQSTNAQKENANLLDQDVRGVHEENTEQGKNVQEVNMNNLVGDEMGEKHEENPEQNADIQEANTNHQDTNMIVEQLDDNDSVSENNIAMEISTELDKDISANNETMDPNENITVKSNEEIGEVLTDFISENKKTDSENIALNSNADLSVSDNIETCSSSGGGKIIIHSIVTIPNSANVVEDSVDYDFNLDDLDESVELEDNSEEDRIQKLLKRYNADNSDPPQISTFKQQLLQQLGNCKPTLSGDPDEVIDFDEGIVKPNPVAQLKERFIKHAATKNVVQNKVKLNIINLSQGEIHNETVAVSVDTKDEPVELTPIPGKKFKKLRNDLQEQIAKHRSELWKQKNVSLDNQETIDMGKKDYEDNAEDFLDDEEEMIEDDTTDEDDNEEDETKFIKEVREKCAFVDDEAEVSDEDECEETASGRSSKMTQQLDDDNTNDSDFIFKSEPKKQLKRIIRGFTEDSDDENMDSSNVAEKVGSNNITKENADVSDDDLTIPPHQPRLDKTPCRETIETKLDPSFHTPITQLTGLQGLNSGSKFLHESPISPFHFPISTPAEVSGAKQKLFADSCDPIQSQDMEDIAKLCSGEFPSTENSQNAQNVEPTTQDLLSICSGGFTGITTNDNNRNDQADENDKHESSNMVDQIKTPNLTTNRATESKYLDDDRIISQLLDEEELEKFKKKFESPVAATAKGEESSLEVQGGGKLIFDSSDDEFTESNPKVSKTIHKKLEFSDDESEEESDDEEIDLHDKEEDEENEENNYKEVDYDSEENEIEQDLVPKEKLKSTDFFDKEAELSESDWDSADEDEGGLDALETEQGDADVFDENKMKSDLEKIHMRRVLDQDNKEIKILQELLLEDGELHGTGRERQFRWRNIDDVANDEGGPIDADEVYLEEGEDESQWRRARHEREMFLKSQQGSVEDNVESILSDSNSQVYKIGHESVRRSLSTTTAYVDKDKSSLTTSSNSTKPSMFANTRGSFLARTDRFLTRLADMTKVTNTVNIVKTSKKIVFQTSVSNENNESNSTNKRKATDGTPAAIKKLRLTSNLSPSLVGKNNKKKLF